MTTDAFFVIIEICNSKCPYVIVELSNSKCPYIVELCNYHTYVIVELCNSKCPDPANDSCVLRCTDDPCVDLPNQKVPDCLKDRNDTNRRKRSVTLAEHWWRCDFPIFSCCRT